MSTFKTVRDLFRRKPTGEEQIAEALRGIGAEIRRLDRLQSRVSGAREEVAAAASEFRAEISDLSLWHGRV